MQLDQRRRGRESHNKKNFDFDYDFELFFDLSSLATRITVHDKGLRSLVYADPYTTFCIL